MGSFATSIHVRANDAAAVADALRHLLFDEGYEITAEEPERGFPQCSPSPLRAIHLSSAREGWVSLLDSEGMGSESLTVALSDRLQTHTIQFFVNDSDSWHYQLHHDGQTIDEFDSCPDDEGFEQDDEESGGGATIDAAEAQRVILERAQQWQQEMLQNMPPRMREIQHKWRTTGQITPEEMQEYNVWMTSQTPNVMAQIRELRSAMSKTLASQAASPANTSRLQKHLEHLRPLLKQDVKDSQVIAVLSEQTTFAEETLNRFLPLLGIAPYYGYLNYSYLAESTSEELARKSIHLVEHLKFKKASGSGAGQRPRAR